MSSFSKLGDLAELFGVQYSRKVATKIPSCRTKAPDLSNPELDWRLQRIEASRLDREARRLRNLKEDWERSRPIPPPPFRLHRPPTTRLVFSASGPEDHMNLNHSQLLEESTAGKRDLKDYSSRDGGVSVYFRNLDLQLVRKIKEADYVFGCVAWLTNKSILDEMAQKKGVSLIIQKEDFLRPEKDSSTDPVPGWKSWLRDRYERLPSLQRTDFHGLLSEMRFGGDVTIEGVRCAGIRGDHQAFSSPKMHHKFLLFAKSAAVGEHRLFDVPYAVWTGSFNFTQNSTYSLENAVFLTKPPIVQAYYNEFQQIAGLSEPLDWTEEYVAPEWRIGS